MRVRTGHEKLLDERRELIRGRRVGLIVNPTSVDANLTHLATHIAHSDDTRLTALFGPEGYNDYAAWGELTGLLAVQFPHLVALNIDDMTDHISSGEISAGTIARVTANMRRHAPWLALATATYFHCKAHDAVSA